jgi:hypothetical protein
MLVGVGRRARGVCRLVWVGELGVYVGCCSRRSGCICTYLYIQGASGIDARFLNQK